ncbi:hypothetical protein [Anabaena sp. UHCC 0399]|uniref:hypothetical protein n=1 Tax=Anabaena sp. UHCC 0399 TaxID=3110238 RepID=UPI001685B2BA|nr:hypothetical protein [Anabaena sp. UHCC 0399]MBD2360640.1 hypothetical protein [Anabaena minutissima FACHB-250]MEA5568058.1 hypothetical protein [Anabaena sp. UHCC 0399]
MLVLENNLFTEVTVEESATVSGGQVDDLFNLDQYLYVLGAGVTFGNSGLTTAEVQFAFESAFDDDNGVNGVAI